MDNATCELLDELARWHGGDTTPSTDYRLALDYFGVKPERVYQYRRGKHSMSDDRIVAICADIWPGDDARAMYWMARVHADREQDVRIRKLWQRMASAAAAVVLVAVFSGFSGVGVQHTMAAPLVVTDQAEYLLCALLLLLARLAVTLKPALLFLR